MLSKCALYGLSEVENSRAVLKLLEVVIWYHGHSFYIKKFSLRAFVSACQCSAFFMGFLVALLYSSGGLCAEWSNFSGIPEQDCWSRNLKFKWKLLLQSHRDQCLVTLRDSSACHADQLHFLGQLRLSSIGKITQKLRKSDMLDFVFSRKRESCQEWNKLDTVAYKTWKLIQISKLWFNFEALKKLGCWSEINFLLLIWIEVVKLAADLSHLVYLLFPGLNSIAVALQSMAISSSQTDWQ